MPTTSTVNTGAVPARQQDAFRLVATNSLWSLAGYFVPILVALLSVPVYTHYLGVDRFGLWMVVLSVFSMTNIFNVGLGDATIKYVSEYYSKGEFQNASRVVYSTFIFYGLVGVAVSLLLWFFRLPVSSFLAARAACDLQLVVEVIEVVCLGVFPSITLVAVLGVFDGQQRFGVSRALIMARSLLIFAVGALVLVHGHGIVALTSVSVAVLWVIWLAGFVAALGSLHRVDLRDLRLFASLRTVWGYGIHTVLINIGDMMTSQLDKLLIANVLGLNCVGLYAVPQMAGAKITEFCGTISRSLMPYFSSVTAVGGTAEHVFFRAWRLSALLAMGITTVLLANAEAILQIWAPAVHNRTTVILLIGFILLALLNTLHVVPYMYVMGKGEPKRVAKVVFGAGVAVSVLTIVLAPVLGIWGVAVAAAVYPIATLLICGHALRMLGGTGRLRRLVFDFVRPVMAHLVIGLLGWALGLWSRHATGITAVGILVSVASCMGLLAFHYALGMRMLGQSNAYYGDVRDLGRRLGLFAGWSS